MKLKYVLPTFVAITALTTPAFAQFEGLGGGGFGMGGFGGGAAADEKPPWEEFKLNPKSRVWLNFRNANVDAIIQTLMQASGLTIIKDPALTAPMTLQSPNQQSLKDAFAMFNSALKMRQFEIKKDGKFLIIRARSGGFGGAGGGRGTTFDPSMLTTILGGQSQTQLKVYPIKYANATQVARVVNEVFVSTENSNPFAGLANMFGGGQGGGGFGGGGGRPGGGGRFNFGGGGGGGGFGGFRRSGGASATSAVKASADDFSNSVIVNAPTKDHDQIKKIIEQIDRQTEQPQTTRVFPLRYASAVDVAPVVQNVLVSNAPRGRGGIGSQNVPIDQRFQAAARFGSTQASFGTVAAEQRTNSIIVTATQENLETVVKIIDQLDKPVAYENSAFVLTLQNARADAISQIINQSFATRNPGQNALNNFGGNFNNGNRRTGSNRNIGGGGGGAGGGLGNNQPGGLGRSSSQGNTRAAETQDDNLFQDGTEIAQGFGGFGGGGFGGGGFGGGGFGGGGFGGGFRGGGGLFGGQGNQNRIPTGLDANGRQINIRDLTGNVFAIPDVNTNSVIIVTSPENRALLKSILEQLDRIPEQVMIETLVVEANLDAANKLGIEWNFTSGSNIASSSFGAQADNAQPQGLRYTLTGNQYGAFLRAVQSDTRFEVLSTPRIFTSNNSTAEINISQSLPYVLSSRTDVTGNLQFNYAFLDVGIILTVTPRITSNGYVTMDVTQTANDLVSYTSFNAPIVNQREAQTTVSVKDGETVVLGGIIKNSSTLTRNKIPLLGDIPLLGPLFQSTNKTKTKTELLVFLTPRIVKDAAQAKALREKTQAEMQSTGLKDLIKVRIKDNLHPDKDAKTPTPPKEEKKPTPQPTSPQTEGDEANG
jgi:general secretion pathway protein D